MVEISKEKTSNSSSSCKQPLFSARYYSNVRADEHNLNKNNISINNSEFENSFVIFQKIQANLTPLSASANTHHNNNSKIHFARNSTSPSPRTLKYRELKKILLISERIRKMNYYRQQQQQPKHSRMISRLNHYNCDYVRDCAARYNPPSVPPHPPPQPALQTPQRIQNEYVKSANFNVSNHRKQMSSFKTHKDTGQEPLYVLDEKKTDSYDLSHSRADRNFCSFHHLTEQTKGFELFKKHGQIAYNQKKVRKKLRENAAGCCSQKTVGSRKLSYLKSHIYFKSSGDGGKNGTELLAANDLDSILTSVTAHDAHQFTLDCLNTSYSSNYFKSDLTSLCNSEEENEGEEGEVRFGFVDNKTSTGKSGSKNKHAFQPNTSDGESQSTSTNTSSSSSESSSRSSTTTNRVETLFDETDEPSFEFARADDDFDTNEQIKSDHDVLADGFNINETGINFAEDRSQQAVKYMPATGQPHVLKQDIKLVLNRLPGKQLFSIFCY
jgi:hypothetical protein